MPVPIGYLTFPEAYNRHYANRYGEAPTDADAIQAARNLDEGLRKEALARRERGLSEDEVLLGQPDELIRWRSFKERQETVQGEITAALSSDEIAAELQPGIRVTAQDWRDLDKHHALLELFDSGVVRSPNETAIRHSLGAYKVLGTSPYLNETAFEEWSREKCRLASRENAVSHNSSQRQGFSPLNVETLGEIWIPFLEAIHRMRSRLFVIDSEAKPLLRSVVSVGRVTGRGEIRERGRLIFAISKEGLDQNPDVIAAPGGMFFEAEKYPAEVLLAELQDWIDQLAAEKFRYLNSLVKTDEDSDTEDSVVRDFPEIEREIVNGTVEYTEQRLKGLSDASLRRAIEAAIVMSVERVWPYITGDEWKELFAALGYEVTRDKLREMTDELREKHAANWPTGDRAKGKGRISNKSVRDQELIQLREKMKSAILRN